MGTVIPTAQGGHEGDTKMAHGAWHGVDEESTMAPPLFLIRGPGAAGSDPG